jgi:hypothetical protein|tara:strand:- start:1151 stop:1966 length:816 start_codon:yes stop_codon:yes gene_type:complete
MPMASSGQLSLGTTAGTDRSIGAAVSGYTNTSNISLKDVSNNATSGTDPADGAPFEMSEFYSYAEFIPYIKTTTGSTGTGTSAVGRFYSYELYNGFGSNLSRYSIRQTTSFTPGSSGGWTQTFYVQENNGTGTYRNVSGSVFSMTTNSLYSICSIFFPSSSGKPDTFRVNMSHNYNNAGLGNIQFSTQTGNATWHFAPNTDHTFYPSGVSSGQTPGDFKLQAISNDECWDGTKTAQSTFTVVYKKSGYADTTAHTFYVRTEHEFDHTGLCP